MSLESLDFVQQLLDELQASEWQLKTPQDYQQAATLAHFLTVVDEQKESPRVDAGIRLLVANKMDEIWSQLQREPWPGREQIGQINDLGLAHLQENSGVWLYGEVALAPALGPRIDGGGSIVLKLLESDGYVLLPASQNFAELTIGTRWLVVGRVEELRRLAFESADGSTQQGTIVSSNYLLAEPELIAPAR